MPGARQIAVAFADLVGFTPLGELVSPEELEQLANRLSEYAHDVAEPPVRFIKSDGDAVMLVSTDTSGGGGLRRGCEPLRGLVRKPG